MVSLSYIIAQTWNFERLFREKGLPAWKLDLGHQWRGWRGRGGRHYYLNRSKIISSRLTQLQLWYFDISQIRFFSNLAILKFGDFWWPPYAISKHLKNREIWHSDVLPNCPLMSCNQIAWQIVVIIFLGSLIKSNTSKFMFSSKD